MSGRKKPLVAVCRQIPEAGLKLLRTRCTVKLHSGDVLTARQLKAFVKGADAILTLLTDKVDAELLVAAGPQLKIIANYAVGFDNLDLEAIARQGLVATNTPGQLTDSVAEHSLALLLATSRRIVEADQFVRAGKYQQWEPLLFWGQPLLGRTLGLVGSGRIGAALGLIAHRGLRMRILYHDVCSCPDLERHAGASRVGLRELLRRSDVVSLHLPLLPSTRHLIGRAELALMKPESILINTARGPVVDETALTEALTEKRIFAAALDVFEHEPTIAAALRRLPNVVLTPHIASATRDAREQMSEMAARNILAVLSGKPAVNLIPLPKIT
jgi:glyoxylate reductase